MLTHFLLNKNASLSENKSFEVEEVDADIISKLALFSRGDLCPMVRFR